MGMVEAPTTETTAEDPLLATGETPDTALIVGTSGSGSSGSESFVPLVEGYVNLSNGGELS